MSATDPQPKVTDFTCWQCKADVGEPCQSHLEAKRRFGHASRQNKWIKAITEWRVREADRRYAEGASA